MSMTQIGLLDEQRLFRESFGCLAAKNAALDIVAEASCYEEARDIMSRRPVDLMLVSATLPGVNAFHATRVMRSSYPRTRIAILDNFLVAVHARQALKAGATGYFTRRESFQAIESGLQAVAAGERVFPVEIADSLANEPWKDEPALCATDSQLGLLSAREIEILRHLAEGLSVKESAEKLHLARSTVDNHKSRLMRKLNVHKSTDLTRIAIREGLISM